MTDQSNREDKATQFICEGGSIKISLDFTCAPFSREARKNEGGVETYGYN